MDTTKNAAATTFLEKRALLVRGVPALPNLGNTHFPRCVRVYTKGERGRGRAGSAFLAKD